MFSKPSVCCRWDKKMLNVWSSWISLSVCDQKKKKKTTTKNTKHLRLMLICAFRAPRIWNGCTEVSSGGTESPAKNLPSFFKILHLHCNITFFFLFKIMTWKTPFSPREFIFESGRINQSLVMLVRKGARCPFFSQPFYTSQLLQYEKSLLMLWKGRAWFFF